MRKSTEETLHCFRSTSEGHRQWEALGLVLVLKASRSQWEHTVTLLL